MEIRIYYESLEQSYNYIAPIINELSSDINLSIRLVKKVGQNCNSLTGVMKAIHSMVAPDILITAIYQEQEIPLIIIEFTEAVQAEDHELQRSYGAIAAFLGDLFYLKVSGDKESEGEFGAADYDPYTTPRMLKEEYGYEGFIIADWETEEWNPLRLQHSPGLHSCPPRIPIIVDTIHCAIRAINERPESWFTLAVSNLKKTESFKEFAEERDNAPTLAELLAVWQKRAKQRYFVNDVRAGAKINRFGHAMDPDRGIIILISCLLSKSHKIYGEYALVRPRHTHFKYPIANLDEMRERLYQALQYDHVSAWFGKMLMSAANKLTARGQVLDITDEWKKNSGERWGTVVRTLAYFCDGLYLGKDGPLLTWNRDELLGGSVRDNFHDMLRKLFGFNVKSAITPVREVANVVDEDEVTYALAHRVLAPNRFRIVSISYPGAQGGTAILPDVGEGKRQKRVYVDLVALPPDGVKSFGALLNESKGMFERASIEEDVQKLAQFKNNPKHEQALKTALIRAQVIDANDQLRDIITGVAFGVYETTETTWRVDEVDFIFRISRRAKWSIGIFRQELADQIKMIAGTTDFPECYIVP